MDFFSAEWFRIETFRDFSWERIWYLYFLPVVPLLFLLRWLLNIRFRQKLQVSLPETEIGFSWTVLLRFVPRILLFLAVCFILIALARPQRQSEYSEFETEGIDIMLVLDVSASMTEKDFQPNRLEAAKQVARNFIKGRTHDRIGIVVFSGEAFLLVPLTTDYDLLQESVNSITSGMISSEGTAIGTALATMTNRMKDNFSKTRIAVLISDGDNTVGNLDPATAAEIAFMHHIKVYTIALSQAKKEESESDTLIKTYDEKTLQEIATTTDGLFFRATDNRGLEQIFAQINVMEKSIIKQERYLQTQDYYTIYLQWAMVFLLLWLFSKSTFMSNILED
jgi:Ca-activated chloride channel family protein